MKIVILLLVVGTSALTVATSPAPPSTIPAIFPRPLPSALICRRLCKANNECKVENDMVVCSCPPGTEGKCEEITKRVSDFRQRGMLPLPEGAPLSLLPVEYLPTLILYNTPVLQGVSLPYTGALTVDQRNFNYGSIVHPLFTYKPFTTSYSVIHTANDPSMIQSTPPPLK
ncbi:uncharacterized protein [Palaemon carinicauda]|uniref:uncharacterized protein n=1 Tax=Palaemon carinicauda TaxID=392227 RepID=UPI0035B5C8BB